jgi:lysyl-tRNA synthetase class 2
MANIEELRNARIQKLEEIKKMGIDPFPAHASRTHLVNEFQKDYSTLKKATLAGRLLNLRSFGKLSFAKLQDESGEIQIILSKDKLDTPDFALFKKLDAGDIVEVSGIPFTTKTQEKSLSVDTLKLLTKSVRPLPEKWHGLSNREERYRRRYVDFIVNKERRELVAQRSRFTENLRTFLKENGFLEVETPIFENTTGGAEAEPFTTHYNALDIDVYLRISLELPLKRLIVGGFEKIYEIGKVFRNEGVDLEHLQEFTHFECYRAYWDYEKLMSFVEEMYTFLLKKTFKKTALNFQGKKIDFTSPWPKKSFHDLFLEYVKTDLKDIDTKEAAQNLAQKLDVKIEKQMGLGRILDQIYKKKIRPFIINPIFLIDHPVEISPLAKRKPQDPQKTERFQPIFLGSEVGNGFSELNDPLDQRKRFEEQTQLRKSGDKEAHMMDVDFVEALEYGMPTCAGFGVSIDRLFMFFAELPSIRDTLTFPYMKPLEMEDPQLKKE